MDDCEFEYLVIDDVDFPEDIINLALCEVNKGSGGVSPELTKFIWDTIRPLVVFYTKCDPKIPLVASHVHIGDVGCSRHNHLPYLQTAVLYATKSTGSLILHLKTGDVEILPSRGRMVIFAADIEHTVLKSTEPEFRLSLVTSYGWK